MEASGPRSDALRLFTPSELGFLEPTSDQIIAAINDLLTLHFDGQCLRISRTAPGNLGHALRKICGTSKVIIPDPLRLSFILRQTVGTAWVVYTEENQFVFKLFPKPVHTLPGAMC